jgi:hypothetical protein
MQQVDATSLWTREDVLARVTYFRDKVEGCCLRLSELLMQDPEGPVAEQLERAREMARAHAEASAALSLFDIMSLEPAPITWAPRHPGSMR